MLEGGNKISMDVVLSSGHPGKGPQPAAPPRCRGAGRGRAGEGMPRRRRLRRHCAGPERGSAGRLHTNPEMKRVRGLGKRGLSG